METAAHIAQLVRKGDPDRYIATLYAPEDKRPALLALYAFSLEVASVRDRIREPLAGELRLQWWRDVLVAEGGGGAQGSPVAEALLKAVSDFGLPVEPLLDMIDARIFDLYNDPMPSRSDLEGYCGETTSALIQLSCLVLDAPAARDVAEAAGHAGCGQAIAGLARLMPLHLARAQCYVPVDILSSLGISHEAFIAGEDREARARALAAMIALGREHVRAFENRAHAIPASLRPAFLPAALAPAYLERLALKGAASLDRPIEISPIRRHWLLFRHAVRGWPPGK